LKEREEDAVVVRGRAFTRLELDRALAEAASLAAMQ
jgi:hypothetical protein